jgi:hypothetical protein
LDTRSKLFKASLHSKYPIIRNKFQTIRLQRPQLSKLRTHKIQFKIKSTSARSSTPWMDPNAMKNSPFAVAGFCVKVVRVIAASYLTACNEVFKSSKMHRTY